MTGHSFIGVLCVIQMMAAYQYLASGDKPRAMLWTCYTITNVITIFIR